MTKSNFNGTRASTFKVDKLTIDSSSLTSERTLSLPDENVDISQIETNVATVSGDLADVDGRVTVNESDIVDLQTNKLDKSGGTITGSLTINENLYVNGTETIVNTVSVSAKDNLIVINAGEEGSGVTAGEAGIEVDRGDLPFYHFKFVESTETFVVGLSGDYQAVATREDSPIDRHIGIWDSTSNQFVTSGIAEIGGPSDFSGVGGNLAVQKTQTISTGYAQLWIENKATESGDGSFIGFSSAETAGGNRRCTIGAVLDGTNGGAFVVNTRESGGGTWNSEALRINSDGISTFNASSAAVAIFKRSGGSASNTGIGFEGASSTFAMGIDSSANFCIKYDSFDLSNSPAFKIDSSGTVTVNNTSYFNGATGNATAAYFNTANSSGVITVYQTNGSTKGYIGTGANVIGGTSANDMIIRAENNLLLGIGNSVKITLSSASLALANILNINMTSQAIISSGSITPTRSFVRVDTESAASTDDLDNITIANTTGDILVLTQYAGTRDVTVRDNSVSSGNIYLQGSSNFSFNNVQSKLVLIAVGSDWHELCRSTN
jgi:hypothetical protein